VSGLIRVGAAEVAVRLQALSAATNTFVAIIAPVLLVELVVDEIVEELRCRFPATRSVPDDGSVQPLLAAVRDNPLTPLVARGDRFGAGEWATLDRRRSSLEREGVTVFVATEASFAELARSAPNLASLFGANVFAFDPQAEETTAAQGAQRLEALRVGSGRSDQDIIDAAEARTLPSDPEYGEWLVLLGRGDLLGGE